MHLVLMMSKCLFKYFVFCFLFSRFFFFFFNDTATTEIYTLPYTTLFRSRCSWIQACCQVCNTPLPHGAHKVWHSSRSEEHTSELQSRRDLVCRLLLEKKKKKKQYNYSNSTTQKYETTCLTKTLNQK